MPPSGPDFPPLLAPGLHAITWAALQSLCVDAFPASRTRSLIVAGLGEVVAELRRSGITGELWVDGSFLTEKVDPNDADLVLGIASDVLENPTSEQENALFWFVDPERHTEQFCDCYVMPIYPAGHPLRSFGEERRAYWERQYGFSRGGRAKGIAVLELTGGMP